MTPALGGRVRYANRDDTGNSRHLQVVAAKRRHSSHQECGNAVTVPHGPEKIGNYRTEGLRENSIFDIEILGPPVRQSSDLNVIRLDVKAQLDYGNSLSLTEALMPG